MEPQVATYPLKTFVNTVLPCFVNVFTAIAVAVTMHGWCLLSSYVHDILQVPSREDEEEEAVKSLEKFVEELPVLELVGKPKHIEPNQ